MNERSIAYFSMENALAPSIPTYAGGLGVLAGDTVRSAADVQVPMVAVSLLSREGYFRQRLDSSGQQREDSERRRPDDLLTEMPARTSVTLEGRTVQLRSWKYEVTGIGGYLVPVFLLDTDFPENSDWDRTLTHRLYGSDQH